MIEDSYVSPAVKRSMGRAAAITKEIVKITGREPKKIFIEMARDIDNANKKQKSTPRKDFLMELYKKARIDEQYLYESLEKRNIGEVRNRRLYLYYLQLGKCMYSGESININELYTNYDIDHIIPQSKLKDDSMNNLVLVKRELNSKKGDHKLPKDVIIDEGVKLYWKMLLDKGFMDKEKYNRLMRKDYFTDDELGGFIARQLVETRQSTKAMAEIFKRIYKSEIVYVKAGNVSDFRRGKKDNDEVVLYNMPKSRLVNDHHHAKDAYLNIVVGNVYHEKFTANPYNFIKTRQRYSLNRVFDYTLKKGDKIIWDAEDDKSYKEVYKQVSKNNVLFTRYARTGTGEFFDENPVKAGKGQFPIKTADKRLQDMNRYGAYNKVKVAHYFLVEHELEKGKREKIIQEIPVNLSTRIKSFKGNLLEYCREDLALKSPRVLIEAIKIDTLFKVNGFYMHISGKTNERMTMKNANQLILSDELYRYTKRIERYVEYSKSLGVKDTPISINDKITKEENIILYDELYNKLKNTIYNVKLSAQVDVFEKGREIFEKLSLEKQAQFLYNAISLFGSSPSGKDLKLIGGSPTAGVITMSSKIKEGEKISIVHQSVTGLFEKEVDLNRL
jgi:CRISPR-associated endonuclease Csn1